MSQPEFQVQVAMEDILNTVFIITTRYQEVIKRFEQQSPLKGSHYYSTSGDIRYNIYCNSWIRRWETTNSSAARIVMGWKLNK